MLLWAGKPHYTPEPGKTSTAVSDTVFQGADTRAQEDKREIAEEITATSCSASPCSSVSCPTFRLLSRFTHNYGFKVVLSPGKTPPKQMVWSYMTLFC